MRTNPPGIGEVVPRLYWQLQGDQPARGEVQTAGQIQVGSMLGAADLWDSGEVNGTPRLLPALHQAGRDDLAYRLMLQTSYPSWLYPVTLGATTMWERWDGWTLDKGLQTVGMNSLNHYAFGAVGQYLDSVTGGINPANPGCQCILIQSVPGAGLTWANTSYHSVCGLISTAWTNTGGVLM